MAVSVNRGVLFVGVLRVGALLYWGCILGPLSLGNSHVERSGKRLQSRR